MSTTASSQIRPTHVIRDDAEALDVARAFAAEIAPGASDRDKAGKPPRAELARLAETGLLGIYVPKAYGGAGVSHETLAKVIAIIATADPAIAQVPQNHLVFLDILLRLGTEDQKRFFFAEILRGARLGNALSERDSANAMEFRTRISRAADGTLRADGTKYYCTGALTAQYVPIFARDEEDRLVAAFLDRDAPGLEIDEDWHAMGQRATVSGTTRLTAVPVAPDRIVQLDRNPDAPQISGAFGQIIHAAIDIGIARAALEDGARLATQSRPWFESGVANPGGEQMVLHRFGQLTAKLWASEELLAAGGRALDAAERDLTAETAAAASLAISAAKAFGGDTALEIANEIFSFSGTRAADDRLNLHRHWRNARTHTLHDAARWKYFYLGNFIVNGVNPPNHGLV